MAGVDAARYAHSPAHHAVAARDHAALRRVLDALLRARRPEEIRTEADSVAEEDGAGGRPLRRRLGGAARTEDFGFAVVGEGSFLVRDPLPVRDSNPRIGLVFAFTPLETVLLAQLPALFF